MAGEALKLRYDRALIGELARKLRPVYPGMQGLAILINGRQMVASEFELKCPAMLR